MKKLWTFIRHQRGVVIGVTLSIIVLVWAYGCESKVRSPLNPNQLVNRAELELEVETFLAQAALKFADLDRQDEFKRIVFENAIGYAQGKPINPIGVIMTIGGILGIGGIIDNQRKDVRIKTQKGTVANDKEKDETT